MIGYQNNVLTVVTSSDELASIAEKSGHELTQTSCIDAKEDDEISIAARLFC